VHERVAAIITAERAVPTLDVGGGDGRLEKCLPADWPSIILDNSPSQVAASANSKILADAVHLPFSHEVVGSVTMLWMLYHLDEPVRAIEESRRVLRPGGLFLACTSSRRNDPELTDGYPATGFDAEEAGSIVSSVFDDVSVEAWDAKMTYLADRDAVLRYCRSHLPRQSAADDVTPPVWLTKRGRLVVARA
jgi:ubiquinone/menaquinone biosynthesis C-methylase UbiE